MQDSNYKNIIKISPKDNQRLIDVFAWLIEEDKKQNPDNYNKLKQKQYD